MKRNFEISVIYFVLFISILCSSCGKKEKESRLQSDTTENISEPLKENDSVRAGIGTKTAAENVKADSIANLKLREKEDSTSGSTEKAYKTQTIAYYFHATARCPSCVNIEKFTEELITNYYAEEYKKGLISFRHLNIEDSANEHYIDDYNLQFSSVILAKFVNNKEVEWKNLERVWKFSNDKKQFFKYASSEIRDFLKGKNNYEN